MRIVFYCPTVIGFAASLVEEIKEIKEIFIPLGAALSAISALSAGHYYLMRIVFYCPDFYCPAEIKEIAEIIVTDPREVLSALSAGNYYLMRIVFLLSRFLLSHGNKRNQGNLVILTLRSPFCYFCPFCGTFIINYYRPASR